MPVSFVSSLLCTLKSFLIVQASPFSNPVSNFLNCLLSFRDRSNFLVRISRYFSVRFQFAPFCRFFSFVIGMELLPYVAGNISGHYTCLLASSKLK